MLSQSNRLKKERDFEDVFKKGRSVKKEFLILKARENQLGNYRFGFVVSQKVSKKAVVRNRIKRILRSAVKEDLSERSKRAPESAKDVVIVVLPGTIDKNPAEIREVAKELLKEANI
jgi:ribonuclease P protein component